MMGKTIIKVLMTFKTIIEDTMNLFEVEKMKQSIEVEQHRKEKYLESLKQLTIYERLEKLEEEIYRISKLINSTNIMVR